MKKLFANFWHEILNRYGSEKDFFDKEATIKEYFAIVPAENRKHCSTYEELYEEALKHVSKQNFEENTAGDEIYFYELSQEEGIIAVFLGVIAYAVARELDQNGGEIEKAIDRVLPKEYDTHNPFDSKDGYGHRIFGHDPITFGLKNIPGNTIINVKFGSNIRKRPIRIGEFLNVDTNSRVSMWDLIWKFYGNDNDHVSGVINCIKHSIVHFGKDLLTPSGLPIPLVSLFNKYEYFENLDASALQYKDSLYKKCDQLGIRLNAGDFASLFVIDAFLKAYCKRKGSSDEKSILSDMKLLAMGTCLSLQMATIILGKGLVVRKRGNAKLIPGGKVNVIMTGAFAITAFDEIRTISQARKDINSNYEKWRQENEG